jgi:glycosyltransferase involved in cell wall biosynthesis
MNLLVVDSVDLPHGGAHSVHVTLLMKGLRENSANAFLIIPHGRKLESLSEKRNIGRYDGIPYLFITHGKFSYKVFRFFEKALATLTTAMLVYKRRKRNRLDGVILGGTVDIIRDSPIITICALLKIPIFFWLVEKASLNKDYQGVTGSLNKVSQRISERFLPKFAAGVIVISVKLKEHYLKYLPDDRLIINPILVSETIYEATKVRSMPTMMKLISEFDQKRILVYSGSFGEKDGLFCLLDAFAQVANEYPDLYFIMTGKGETDALTDKVTGRIRTHNLQDRVRLVGFVTSEELISYNTLADILFVCRSNSAFANHGFPWKLGEYCMTGKPIVATRVSDIEMYFQDSHSLFIVEPNNSTAIASKIRCIFDGYDDALRIGRKSKEVAIEMFDYRKKSKELLEFMEGNINMRNSNAYDLQQ